MVGTFIKMGTQMEKLIFCEEGNYFTFAFY